MIRLGLLIAGLAVSSTFCRPVQALSIEDAITISAETHPSVRAAQAFYQSSTKDPEILSAAFKPQVTLDTGTTWVKSNTPGTRGRHGGNVSKKPYADVRQSDATVSLSKTIWDAGRNEGAVTAAEKTTDSLLQDARSAQYAVGQRAAAAYIEVFKNRQIVALLDDALENAERYLRMTEDRVDSGQGTVADLTAINGQMNFVETLRYDTLLALRNSEAQYIEAVGEAPGELNEPSIPKMLDGMALEELIYLAFEEHPNIQSKLSNNLAKKASLEASVPAYMPTLTLNLSAGRELSTSEFRVADNEPSDSKTTYKAGVRMSMSLYDSGSAEQSRQKAVKNLDEAVQREAETRRTIEQGVRLAFAQMVSNTKKLPVQEFAVETAMDAFENANDAFNSGDGTILDKLAAEIALYNAEIQRLTTYYAGVSGQYAVLNSVGRLLVYAGAADDTLKPPGQ